MSEIKHVVSRSGRIHKPYVAGCGVSKAWFRTELELSMPRYRQLCANVYDFNRYLTDGVIVRFTNESD